jgi:hypothetical protein
MSRYTWSGIETLSKSRSYTCGYCGNPLSSEKGFRASLSNGADTRARIYVCHHCNQPTYFDPAGNQTPGITFGNVVEHISDAMVAQLYDEARRCTGSGSHTAAVLCCRKLLMHIAVSKGAEEGKNFVTYVEFLADKGFVPPDARGWVDHIRQKGNEANHEIVIMTPDTSKDLLAFCEMLLKVIYEFPARIRLSNAQQGTAANP